jgi:osmotically-inducible protein OsmY
MTDDATLKRRVTDELRWDTRVNEAHVGVSAHDGSVTLSGHVPSYPEKYAAVDAAKRVRGVHAVADEIEVELPYERSNDDGAVAERIAHVLEWNVSIPEDSVKARVANGFVTLTGEVEWQHQRRHVEEQVRHVGGVRGIANTVVIRARATPSDIKRRIEDALERQAEVEARGLRVDVQGDRVILEGRIKATHERDVIERAVWAAPGVREVVDHLRVS